MLERCYDKLFALLLVLTLLALTPTGLVAQITFYCSAVDEIPQAECEALTALYDATDGYKWADNDGWLVTNEACAWHGVTCRDGHVVALDLSENRLNGPLPPEIGDLTGLTILALSSNQLSGSIPPELANLTALTELHLGDNPLSGPIPAWIGDLTALTGLYLWGNEFNGPIPPELGNLTGLTILALSNNRLSGSIPPELGNLTALKELYLWNNELKGSIPPELGNLTPLTMLALSENQLSGSIPPEIGNLITLTELHLGDNQLSGPIPAWISDLKALKVLWLSKNQLSGPIPPEIGELTTLERLNLHDNQLHGPLPPEIGNLAALTELWLHDNELSGPIIPEIGHLTALKSLHLTNNQLSGSIPSEIGKLTNLEWLAASRNRLSGPIPPEIGNLTALIILVLSENQLSGTIPPELGNLSALESLYLADNQLSGELPVALTQLQALQTFTFDEPDVHVPPDGPVPAWLASFGHPSGKVPSSDTRRSEIRETLPYLLNLLIVLAVVGALIFMWTERWRRPKSAPYEAETAPRGITAQETRTGLMITYHSPILRRLFALAFLAVILFMSGQEIVSGQYFRETRLGVLFIPIMMLFAYGLLATLLNSTSIQAEEGMLTIRRGPIPMPGNREAPLREITQIYCQEKVHRSRRTSRRSYSYALYAIMRKDGEKIHLISFSKPAQARYVERQLERHLGIQDVWVGGEFPK
ncbi:MAG TPA: hypothetical protein ENN19_03780 [Chloroflexi bacterium]|nr:hypothetical protein [Chloroflexota bacterium]